MTGFVDFVRAVNVGGTARLPLAEAPDMGFSTYDLTISLVEAIKMIDRFLFTLLFLCCGNAQLALAESFSAEHLVRLGAPAVSPDGSQVVYALRKTDMEAGKGRYDLWLSATAGGKARPLTTHAASDSDPAWSPDGRFV